MAHKRCTKPETLHPETDPGGRIHAPPPGRTHLRTRYHHLSRSLSHTHTLSLSLSYSLPLPLSLSLSCSIPLSHSSRRVSFADIIHFFPGTHLIYCSGIPGFWGRSAASILSHGSMIPFPDGHTFALGTTALLQGYLAHKKTPPSRTLHHAYA